MAAGEERYLALDLGAESGRGVVGTLSAAGTLVLDERHRFPNGPIRMGETLHWDLPRLVSEIDTAIRAAASTGTLSGVGVDTWGVDFGLIGPRGELVGLPVHYRDARTNGMVERVFERVPRADVFARTGIQVMPINTLYQLAALAESSPRLLDAADRLLFMPDLLHFFLTGRAAAERTIASTSQMLDPNDGSWATEILDALNIPTHILPEVVPAGTEYGALRGFADIPVYAPGGHDTACAVAAVPADDSDGGWAYLSSGTWSLLGVESSEPIINEATQTANFTNEGGVADTTRLLKNIAGLWLVQECRRAWARAGRDYSYEELGALAAGAPGLISVVNPDHPSLLAPPDMPAAIAELCAQSGEPRPDGVGATVRCCLDSLALKYRWTLEKLESITGRPIETLHIVGGGTRNRLLNQLAADATGRRVRTGPVEATAIGNVLLQARSRGRIASLAELRAIVRASFPIETFVADPDSRARFDDAYAARFVDRVPSAG